MKSYIRAKKEKKNTKKIYCFKMAAKWPIFFLVISISAERTSHSFKEYQPMHRRRNFLKENLNENSWKLLKWLLVYLYTLNRPLFCF